MTKEVKTQSNVFGWVTFAIVAAVIAVVFVLVVFFQR